MADPTHTVHGVPFIRTGSCNRCPNIKPAPCCLGCPHFAIVNKQNTCLIYNKRGVEVCQKCSLKDEIETHQECIDFPEHPWLGIIWNLSISTICSYKFEEIKTDDISKFDELNKTWR